MGGFSHVEPLLLLSHGGELFDPSSHVWRPNIELDEVLKATAFDVARCCRHHGMVLARVCHLRPPMPVVLPGQIDDGYDGIPSSSLRAHWGLRSAVNARHDALVWHDPPRCRAICSGSLARHCLCHCSRPDMGPKCVLRVELDVVL